MAQELHFSRLGTHDRFGEQLKAVTLTICAVIFCSATTLRADATAVAGCFNATVGIEVVEMPIAFDKTKGTTPLGIESPIGLNGSKDFQNKLVRFGNGAIYYLKELLGEGQTAAVFALDTFWAIRLNTQMDFLPGYVQGQEFCKFMGVPTVDIRVIPGRNGKPPALEQFPSEYVVIRRAYPKHFDRDLTPEDEGSFKKATALHLYENWDNLHRIEREVAHQELKEFLLTLSFLETYFDFQPSNVVRTTTGWRFIDPSFAIGETNFATPQSKVVPFAVPKLGGKAVSNNWFNTENWNFSIEARKKLAEHVEAILEYRRLHPLEVRNQVARAKAHLGIP